MVFRQSKNISGILVKGVFYADSKKYLEEKIDKVRIDGIIRIKNEEYISINRDEKYLTHFNLQVSHHKVGFIYALPRIIKSGYFTQKEERLPDLSFDNIVIAECVQVKEYLKYEELNESHFKYSFKTIKNTKELQKVILSRYCKSMPELTKKEILSLGVSMTKLKIIN